MPRWTTLACVAASIAMTSCRGCSNRQPADAEHYPAAGTAKRTEVNVDCGSTDPRATFIHGWAMPEEGRYRWSLGPRSRVDFFFRPTDDPYQLTLEGHGYPGKTPQIVTVRMNGRAIGAKPFTGSLQFTLAREILVSGRNSLELEYAWTRAPADDNPISPDGRRLAIALHRFSVLRMSLAEGAVADARRGNKGMLLGTGWSGVERDGDRAWIWSDGPESRLVAFVGPKKRTHYEVAIDGMAALPRLDVEVLRNDVVIGRGRLPNAASSMTIRLAPDSIDVGENELRLRYSETVVPSGGHDPRHLALQIWRLELRPVETGGRIEFGR